MTVVTRTGSDSTYYPLSEAARLAGVSSSRLKRWMRIGIATPTQRVVTPRQALVTSGFSLADVGYLHLLNHLVESRVPLERAVGTLYHFEERFGSPGPAWHNAIVAIGSPVAAGVVAYAPDDWQATLAIPGTDGAGQRFFDLLSELLPAGVTLESLLIPAEFIASVEIDPSKQDGLPVVRGTGIRTSTVRALYRKYGLRAVTEDYYPHIPPDDVEPATKFEDYLDRAV